VIFLDTSALVKAYITEPGTEVVKQIIRSPRESLVLSEHVALEVLATLSYKYRDGQFTSRRYRKAREAFFRDYEHGFIIASVTNAVVQTAMELADTHRQIGVGSLDLIHVATALHLREAASLPSITVACADRSMRLLASAAGFQVFDPENDDVARLGAAAN
jgi:predicted nucleic acid-binding protein